MWLEFNFKFNLNGTLSGIIIKTTVLPCLSNSITAYATNSGYRRNEYLFDMLSKN